MNLFQLFFADTDEDDDDSFINDGSDNESRDADDKPYANLQWFSSYLSNNLRSGKISPMSGDLINLISDESDTDGPSKKKPKNSEKGDNNCSGSDSSVDEVVRNWSTLSRSGKRNELVDSDEDPLMNGTKNGRDAPAVDKHWWSDIIQVIISYPIIISS